MIWELKIKILLQYHLIAPTTSEDRISQICTVAAQVLYITLLLEGVTGSSHLKLTKQRRNINLLDRKPHYQFCWLWYQDA